VGLTPRGLPGPAARELLHEGRAAHEEAMNGRYPAEVRAARRGRIERPEGKA